MSELYLTITVVNRDSMEDFITFCKQHGGGMVLTAVGRGTASDEVLDYLGLEAEDKAVLFSIASYEQSKRILKDLVKEMYLDVPGNGVSMNIPLNSIGGTMKKFGVSNNLEDAVKTIKTKDGENMNEAVAFNLIIAVTNMGYTDMVMDAARAAGATGGTVIHARGSGMEQAEKFFGVSISTEKEIIFIACSAKDKSNIMKEIMAGAGMKTKAQSMVMSVPLESLVGIRSVEEDTD